MNQPLTSCNMFLTAALLTSCSLLRPDPIIIKEVTCIKPPEDVVIRNAEASVDLTVKKIGQLLKASSSVRLDPVRVREISNDVNDFEVVEYRMCVAYANGIVSREQYSKFLTEFLPLAKSQSS